MAKYMTKQRQMLLDVLAEHHDEALCARQIALLLGGNSVSVSAVYRNLSYLEESGSIKRIPKAGSHEVYYQYTSAPQCREKLHLSCKKCGKTFHMDTDSAENLISSIEKSDCFIIDKAETVLYGICSGCQEDKQ